MAVAVVKTLKVEPGSYTSTILKFLEQFNKFVILFLGGLFKSKLGLLLIAKISPLLGFITIAVAVLGICSAHKTVSAVSTIC